MGEPDRILWDRAVGETLGLRAFVELAWHIVEPSTRFIPGWHIDAQCEHYEAIERKQIKTLVTNIPPGCSKSKISGVYWPVWAWINKTWGNPGLKWGHFSFDGDNTLLQGRDSLALMQSDWFVARWGYRFGWVQREPADGDYFNTLGGRLIASSVDGKASGNHYHRQVIDDPLKPKGVSTVTLEGCKKWLSGTMATRWVRGDTFTARALVMQRLHEDDTTAQILATDINAVHLMLPMEFEPARKCVVYFGPKDKLTNKDPLDGKKPFFEDPRTEEGELLCPEFMTPEVLEILKSDLTAQEQSAQLQQNPTAKGGNIFKDENFRFWIQPGATTDRFDQAVPPRKYILLPTKFDRLWQSWDFTFKDVKTADFVCGEVWGQVKADFFLLWQVCDRMDFTASVKAIKGMSVLFPRARKKLVEDKANGTAIMSALKGRMFGIEAVEPEGGKEARASACAPMFESGNVYIPDPDMPGFEWVRPYMAQMTSFPFAKNDDQVDCTSQALNWGSSKATRFAAAMERLQGDTPAAQHLRKLLARMGQ